MGEGRGWDNMKNILSNSGYFLKETFTIIRLSFLSNIFSLLSIGLILFILAAVLSGWQIFSGITEAIGDRRK
jgi:cell division transport system permease protein